MASQEEIQAEIARRQGPPQTASIADIQAEISRRQQPDQEAQPAQQAEQQPSLLQRAAAVPLEAMAAVNKTAVELIDFLGPDQINAVLELSGSDKRVPTLGGTKFAKQATAGEFMEEGLARDIVQSASQVAASAVAPQAALRGAAAQLPRMVPGVESIGAGALRQVAQQTAPQAAITGGVAGVGAALGGEAGEFVGGETGRQVGEIAGGLVAPIAGQAARTAVTPATRVAAPTPRAVVEGQEATAKTGVPLFKAQQTLDPAQIEKQSFIPQLPAGSQLAQRQLKIQNEAAADAVDTLLKQIAPDSAVVEAAGGFRSASQRAVKARKDIRSEASSPIYKQAFRRQRQGKLAPIDTSSLETKISQMVKQFDPAGQISKNLNSSLSKIRNADGNLQKLHLAKTEIDQTINTFGADSVGNTTKRFMTGVKNDLTEQLVSQSPSYKAARDEFIRLTPGVTGIQDSIIGKISQIDDTQLKAISRKIFDPSETNTTVIRQAKRVIDDVDPDAWNKLVRSEMERRIGSIKVTQETSQNIPGQLNRAIFGNKKQRDILFNGVEGDVKKNLAFLETSLKRAALGRGVGSQTAAREK